MRHCLRSFLPMVLAAACGLPRATAQDKADDFAAVVTPFFQKHCVACHGPENAKGKLTLHQLRGDEMRTPEGAQRWLTILEQIGSGAMPPADKPRPSLADQRRVAAWIDERLAGSHERQFPAKGNLVDHRLLFGDAPIGNPASTAARFWRISPYAHRQMIDNLTGGPVLVQAREVKGVTYRFIETPLVLGETHGFRDYAFRHTVTDSTLEQWAMNARLTVEVMISPRATVKGVKHSLTPSSRTDSQFVSVFGGQRIKEVADLADAKEPLQPEQSKAAVRFVFGKVLTREPTAEEVERYTAYAARCVEKFGNRDGVIRGLAPVLLHPESLFRAELSGPPDAGGRAILEPVELARAIALALTDQAPDAELLIAVREGRLASRDDVRRQVERLLNDPKIEKPRLLRFFQEYFEYVNATTVFKDNAPLAKAGLQPKDYRPSELVEDTDVLVLYFIQEDRRILRNLLTTDLSFISSRYAGYWGYPASLNDIKGCKKEDFFRIYGLANPQAWTAKGPMTLPKDQRSGVLTQPSWLVAHSNNEDNNAILRGKWIRERLLGGMLPDVPVGVDAALPDEPKETLRHRMRVTREQSCWKCHQQMDTLGLPFEQYDFVGQFRAREQGKRVEVSGEIAGSGDPKLDGPVAGPLELIRKLADSERVHQVFVRHAFRYWMARNETRADAAVLQEAYRAYQANDESLRALVTSLLTSDAFLYREK